MLDPFATRYRLHPLSQSSSEVTSQRRRLPKISLIQVTKPTTSTLVSLFELLTFYKYSVPNYTLKPNFAYLSNHSPGNKLFNLVHVHILNYFVYIFNKESYSSNQTYNIHSSFTLRVTYIL